MSWPVAFRSFEPSCPCCVCVMRQVALSYTSCTARARQQVAEPASLGFLQMIWGSFMMLAHTPARPHARTPARPPLSAHSHHSHSHVGMLACSRTLARPNTLTHIRLHVTSNMCFSRLRLFECSCMARQGLLPLQGPSRKGAPALVAPRAAKVPELENLETPDG